MNNGRLTQCPFYLTERGRTITCEDTRRLFDSEKEKGDWMDKYCDDKWQECEYAKKMNEAYEQGIVAEEKEKATRNELRSVTRKLLKAEKSLKAREEEIKALQEQADKWERGYLRKAEELKKEEELTQLQAETMAALAIQFEARLAYLIDMYVPGKHVDEADIDTWIKSVEYILDGTKDDTGHVIAWDVKIRKRSEDEN